MGRNYAIANHPQRKQIEKAILEGHGASYISSNFGGVSETSVRRYIKDKMPKMLRSAELSKVEGLIERITEYIDNVDELHSSIMKWLEDPDNPGSLTFDPKASEVNVIVSFTEDRVNKNGELYTITTQQRMTLQEAIDIVEESGDASVKKVSLGIQDPRLTMLRSAEVLNKQLELLAKARGEIVENTTTIVNTSADLSEIIQIASKALSNYPGALEAFAEELAKAAE